MSNLQGIRWKKLSTVRGRFERKLNISSVILRLLKKLLMWFIYITLLSGRERQRNVPKCKTHERAEKLEHVERAQRKKSTAHAKRTARAKRA